MSKNDRWFLFACATAIVCAIFYSCTSGTAQVINGVGVLANFIAAALHIPD